MDEYIGVVKLFAGNFTPEGYLECNGQTILKSMYPALYAIIGGRYGESGTTFNVPNLNGRVVAGLSPGVIEGTIAGQQVQTATTTVTLTAQNLPPHSHGVQAVLNVNNEAGSSADPRNMYIGNSGGTDKEFNSGAKNGTLATDAITVTETPLPAAVPVSIPVSMNVVQPTMYMRYIICYEGQYPTRP